MVWVCPLELWLLLKVILVGFTFSYFFQYDPRWSNVSLLRGWLCSFGKIERPLQHDRGTYLRHAENPKMDGMRSKTVLWVCWNDLRIKPLEVQIFHSSCGWILSGKGQVSIYMMIICMFWIAVAESVRTCWQPATNSKSSHFFWSLPRRLKQTFVVSFWKISKGAADSWFGDST